MPLRGRETFQTALIWTAVAALAFLLWWVRTAIVLSFAAILLAIFLRAIARIICHITPMREAIGILLAVLLVLILFVVTAWLFGSSMAGQLHMVAERVSAGEKSLTAYLQQHGMASFGSELKQNGTMMFRGVVSGFLPTLLHVLEAAIVLLVSGIYLAAKPEVYREGIVMLFGRDLRDKVEEGLDLIGTSLELWLFGQIIVMAVVGVLCAVAMWLIGLPDAAALGLIAGILEMVPYLGPFIGAVPSLFVALAIGVDAAMWTLGVYIGIHVLEGYLLAPLLQRHFLRIPPALILVGIFIAGLIFGILGIVVAAPLTAAIFIGVKVFYVRDVLEEKTEIPDTSPLP